MKHKLLSLLLALIASTSILFAESGTCGANLTWTLNDSVLTISGTGAMKNYSSSAPWYTYRTSIKEIVLNSGLTTIGQRAFYWCSNITSIEIPNTVTSIGYGAFCYCSNLSSVSIPGSVKSIGDDAFLRCAIKAVYISDLAAWCKINNYQYGTPMQKGANLYLNGNLVENLVIPNGVTNIGSYAFENCNSLKTITIGGDVTSVGKYAFSRCANLTKATISDGVTGMGSGVFKECSSLIDVTLSYSFTTLPSETFSDCSSLASIIIPDGVTSIGVSTFSGCSNLTSITIPNNVTSIGIAAFRSCSKLTAIELPNIPSIENQTFSRCGSLTYITIPNSVTNIGQSAFSDCSSLTSMTIPNSVTSIGSYAFSGCSSLDSISIPNSVMNIEKSAFESCNNIANINFDGSISDWCESMIPSSLMNRWTGGRLYMRNTLLTNINIPYGITSIKDYTFHKCSDITSVTIPQSVNSIGKYAFSNCAKLDSLTLYCRLDSVTNNTFANSQNMSYLAFVFTDSIPSIKNLFSSSFSKSLKEIELLPGSICCGTGVNGNNHLPFMGLKNLEEVTIPANIVLVPDSCFMGCTNLREVNIGLMEAEGEEITDSTAINIPRRIKAEDEWNKIVTETRVGKSVFAGCYNLTSIKFAKGVQTIDDAACKGLVNLTTISLANTVKHIGEETFEGCGLTNLIIPTTLESIGYRAFANNINLTNVNMQCPLDACVTGNGINLRKTFEGSNNIVELSIVSTGSTAVGDQMWCMSVPEIFPNLEKLTSINFLDGSTQVYMGGNYPELSNVRLTRGIKIIRGGSFNYCPKLTTITLPDQLEYIGNAFVNSGLMAIEIPDKVTTIFDHAFTNCTDLEKVVLSRKCTEIGNDAFRGCTAIKCIVAKSDAAPKCLNENVFGELYPRRNILWIPEGDGVLNSYMNERVWPSFLSAGYSTFEFRTNPVQTAEAIVEAQATQASLSFPQENNAVQYNIALSDGEDYNINFPLSSEMAFYNVQANSPARIKKEEYIPGFKFGITGLTPLTTYNYTLTAYDENSEVIAEYTGTFTTIDEEETSIDDLRNKDERLKKFLRDGQIFILRDGKTYTITGQEVK